MNASRTLAITRQPGAALAVPLAVQAGERTTGPVICVTSLGQYSDSIVPGELPMQGRFQQLIPGEKGLETEFGPGQPGAPRRALVAGRQRGRPDECR